MYNQQPNTFKVDCSDPRQTVIHLKSQILTVYPNGTYTLPNNQSISLGQDIGPHLSTEINSAGQLIISFGNGFILCYQFNNHRLTTYWHHQKNHLLDIIL